MVSNLYLIALLITLGNLVYLTQKKDRPVARNLWAVMIILPVVCLGYWLKSTVHTTEGAFISFCFIYIDSTILLTIAFFSILRSIRVHVPGWIKVGVYGITVFHLLTIWLSKDNNLYYSSMTLLETDVGVATRMTSGPLKISHYIFLATIMISIVVALLFGIFRKGTYSKKTLFFYSIFAIVGFAVYIYEMFADVNFSMLPGMYCLGSIFLTVFYDNFQCHSIYNLIGEKKSKTDLVGFVAFDKKKFLLGYNSRFASIFPDIDKVVIDSRIENKYQKLSDFIYPLLDRAMDQGNFSDVINIENKFYNIDVNSFSVEQNRIDGYLIELSDITEEKKRIEIIQQYNETLGKAVDAKTNHILGIQNSVVLGLANLVENRDNNTGGHIKRTSDIIRILVEEAMRQGLYKIDEEKAADIVRAAPMHDLGKMYIETQILCKPAKLNDDEYQIMKSHATKSGEFVQIILDGVEEPHFVDTAFQIARHHHERWDGKGYPDGLMGANIPLEARIMAVADVYDALVSKRCYKEPMSFDLATKIMNENMGSQFDPAMRPIFNNCKTKLEEYYSNQ